MSQHSFEDFPEDLHIAIRKYEALKAGKSAYLEEEAFELLVDHYLENEASSEAFDVAEFGLEQHAQSPRLMLKKADVLLVLNRPEEAIRMMDKSYLFDRADPTYYILKTEALLALDRQEEAAQLLETAIEFFEGAEKIELLFELTDVYDDYEDFDKVFDCLKYILELDPVNEEALFRICFWTDMTGRNEEGIRLHQQIIEEHPFNHLAWFNLGAAYQGLKLYEKSIDAYQFAVAIDEKFDYAYRNMGDAFIRLRRYREAIEMLQTVIELAPPESILHEAIGHCYDRLLNFAQARFYYKKAHHIEPEDHRLVLKIATTYMNQGNWIQAIKQLDSVIQKEPFDPAFHLAMGRCFMHLNKFDEAIQYMGMVVKVRPKNMSGWTELLHCFYRAGKYEEGYNSAAMAFEQTHGKAIFIYYKAAFLFAMGMSKQGLLYLEHAVKENPKLVQKFIDIDASLLQFTPVVEVLARLKRSRSKKK